MRLDSSICWKIRSPICALILAGVASGVPTNPSGSVPGREIRNNTSKASTTTSVQDGHGLQYAESCQQELFAYSSSSSSWESSNRHSTFSYYTNSETFESVVPGTTAVPRLVTLCDGHPRVVGHPSSSEGPSMLVSTTWTNTIPTFVPAPYPGPSPTCAIGPKDCELLYSSWTSHYAQISSDNMGLRNPPCTMPTPTFSFSTENGHVCDNCLIIGSKIRLLYWPVTTAAGKGNICSTDQYETITAEPAGGQPRTFVTEGITITSPTVAISIGGLSRVDQCGRTIAHTVLPVLPQDVTSVRGARALFGHYPFNFADLNYRCLDSPDEIFVDDVGRDDCYQEVPEEAYFNGEAIWAGMGGTQLPNATIWNNYQPQVLPPSTLSDAIRNIWGNNCYVQPDGVWDPPIALQEVSTIALPTLPHAYSPTPSADAWTSSQTQPTPGGLPTSQPSPTAPPDQVSSGSNPVSPGQTSIGSPNSVTVIHSYTRTLTSASGNAIGEQPSADFGPAMGPHYAPTSQIEETPVYTVAGSAFTYSSLADREQVLLNGQTTFVLHSPLAGSSEAVDLVLAVGTRMFTASAMSDGRYALQDGTSTFTVGAAATTATEQSLASTSTLTPASTVPSASAVPKAEASSSRAGAKVHDSALGLMIVIVMICTAWNAGGIV